IASLAGILLGGGVLWGVAEVYHRLTGREGMGGGDIKLLAMIGAFLGWQAVPVTLMIASLAGTAVGVALIVVQRGDRRTAIPFGPFLAVGAICALFWGDALIAWYLGAAQAACDDACAAARARDRNARNRWRAGGIPLASDRRRAAHGADRLGTGVPAADCGVDRCRRRDRIRRHGGGPRMGSGDRRAPRRAGAHRDAWALRCMVAERTAPHPGGAALGVSRHPRHRRRSAGDCGRRRMLRVQPATDRHMGAVHPGAQLCRRSACRRPAAIAGEFWRPADADHAGRMDRTVSPPPSGPARARDAARRAVAADAGAGRSLPAGSLLARPAER